MSTETVSSNRPVRLSSVTIRDVLTLKGELINVLDSMGDVQIDGHAVKRVDTAALQLLVAFILDLKGTGRCLEWTGCSTVLWRAATVLGLASALGLFDERN